MVKKYWETRNLFVLLFMLCIALISLSGSTSAQGLSTKVQVKPVGNIDPLPDNGDLSNAMSPPYASVASSAHDIWASGTYPVCGYRSGHCYAIGTGVFFEHYDGQKWSLMYPDNPGGYESITNMAEPIPNAVYAVGEYETAFFGTYYPDLLQWNNGNWTRMTIPLPSNYTDYDSNRSQLIAAISSKNIWASWQYIDANSQDHLLLEHYDGHSWSIVSVPANITGITTLQRQSTSWNDSTVLAFGTDGTTTQVLSLKA